MYKHLVNEMTRKNIVCWSTQMGGVLKKKIGAAAVGPTTTRKIFLGSISSFTIYSVELCGIFLAKEITLEEHIEPSVVIIWKDN